MNIIRPLQLSVNQQVLEQDRTFYFTVSASLGINLQTGEELLDLNYLKDMFECMGEAPQPDMGMPKPNGEFLVSGSFFAPNQEAVPGGKVTVKVNNTEKTIYIFGPRYWEDNFPSEPKKILSMPLEYSKAFGGKGYEKNPDGIGYKDGLLPCIEHPKNLTDSPKAIPDPAGLSPLAPMLPQRMQYQGTYDENYQSKFFPGYPDDHDWHSFLCAPQDQWITGYYTGEESYALHNLHPELPIISGTLPGLYPRCFFNEITNGQEVMKELPLKLDTIWFFPEKLLGLLIFRGVTKVADDEAETISDLLCGYEKRTDEPRTQEYYHQALQRRKESKDGLLKNLNTRDLIPEGHKSAMELLMDTALSGERESPLADNLDAKAEALQKMADEKIEEAIQQAEKNLEGIDIPDEAWEHLPDETKAKMPGKQGGLNIRDLIKARDNAEPDADVQQLNERMEAILPGITAGDPKKLEMRDFSFDKIDEIMEAVEEFSGKKEKEAKDIAAKEIAKAREQVEKQVADLDEQIEQAKATLKSENSEDSEEVSSLEEARQKVQESLQAFDDIDLDGTAKKKAPLPRIDVEEIRTQTQQINPQLMQAMQHVQTMKDMGIEDDKTQDLEKQIKETLATTKQQVEEALIEAEKGFREGYIMGAHFMEEGLSPHKDPVDEVTKRFLERVSTGEKVSGGDWACLDLADQNLAGIDLSDALLEQVNFKGADLKGVNFSGAILARADLEGADCSGANFTEANIGAVHALQTDFTGANLKSAKLSKGNFTEANFAKANLEDIEALELIIDRTNFSNASMPKVTFLQLTISGANFSQANINTSAFLQCKLTNCTFSEAVMHNCAFVDTTLETLCFDKADLSSACFVATEPEKSSSTELTFQGTLLNQANFQNMDMHSMDFNHARMENAFFGATDLSGANLSYGQAKNAQFRKANLRQAVLDHINLDQGSLAKADLTQASFRGANLHGVDVLRAKFKDTNLKESNLDATLIEHWSFEQ
ncbi:MAG: DUF2169 domain-containing protein [Candidatus Electrothrix scaldis]|nr:MAG: DUF2169 domain-containing protein [Candidatus Electrothrix sp. GW3-3]